MFIVLFLIIALFPLNLRVNFLVSFFFPTLFAMPYFLV